MKLWKEDLLEDNFKFLEGSFVYYSGKDMANFLNLEGKLEPLTLIS